MNPELDEPTDKGLALLQTEIAFWRELICECASATSPECMERMKYALALAEKKVAERQRSNDNGFESQEPGPWLQ